MKNAYFKAFTTVLKFFRETAYFPLSLCFNFFHRFSRFFAFHKIFCRRQANHSRGQVRTCASWSPTAVGETPCACLNLRRLRYRRNLSKNSPYHVSLRNPDGFANTPSCCFMIKARGSC